MWTRVRYWYSFPCPQLTWTATSYEEWIQDWQEVDITINGLYPEITLEEVLLLYYNLYQQNESNWKQTIGGY